MCNSMSWFPANDIFSLIFPSFHIIKWITVEIEAAKLLTFSTPEVSGAWMDLLFIIVCWDGSVSQARLASIDWEAKTYIQKVH